MDLRKVGNLHKPSQGPLYSLTAAGRKQLGKETTKWKRLTAAIGRILEAEEG